MSESEFINSVKCGTHYQERSFQRIKGFEDGMKKNEVKKTIYKMMNPHELRSLVALKDNTEPKGVRCSFGGIAWLVVKENTLITCFMKKLNPMIEIT